VVLKSGDCGMWSEVRMDKDDVGPNVCKIVARARLFDKTCPHNAHV
jgi:hypothetical protein